ncbi:heme-binding domain-containing protein [Algoriphagus jejuensis]|uniref:Heme-binding domain-containing protein n=1 Tax=Algoriphagus jejuensis TaxID=419934 RepID=A0ABN1N089_9BACT
MQRRYWLLGGSALLFLAIQFVPNELPPVVMNNPDDLIQSGIVREEISSLLKVSCYNCHSNETEYPWYSYVAPSSWLVAKDVREAREELNFSNWQTYDMMEKLEKLDDISIEVDAEKMPLGIYTLIHTWAKLDETQRQLIVDWAEETMDVVVEEGEEDVGENE